MIVPAGLRLTLDPSATPELRTELGARINAFHAETIPNPATRFTLTLHDADNHLAAGLSATLSWTWLFIEALWVDAAHRGRGAGRALMAHAEAHAREAGCHSAWLDTYQAPKFYEALGYTPFAALEDYPPGQTRTFLRKRLL